MGMDGAILGRKDGDGTIFGVGKAGPHLTDLLGKEEDAWQPHTVPGQEVP